MTGKYRAYPEYKPSGVGSTPEIPTHWVSGKVKFVTSSLDKIRIPLSAEERGDRKGEYPYYGASGIIDYVDDYLFDEETILFGEDGANLIARSSPLAFLAKGKYWVNNHAHILKTKDGVNDYWVMCLESIDVTTVVSGSAQPKLTAEALGDLQVVYPPTILERKKIANFLNHETAKIDALIEKQQQLIKLLKEKRQAVISHAVTKGLNPNAPMKDSGVEWLGDVPAHWVVKRLKHISPKVGVGLVINPSTYTCDEGVYFIFGGDVKEYRFDLSKTRRISPENSNNLLPSRLNCRDLVSVRVGYPGITAVVSEELEGSNCASVIVIRKGCYNSDWLCAAMNSWVGRQQVDLVSYGAAQKQYNVADAIEFVFSVPPKNEQNEIANYVEASLNRFNKLSEKTKQQIKLLHERRTALISAAVTGKIDVC